MKTKILISLALLSAVIFSSCSESDEVQLVTVENKYSLSIPAFLSEASTLNDDASLQYQHLFKEFYVIAIDEPRNEADEIMKMLAETGEYENNVNGYCKLILESFSEDYTSLSKFQSTDTVINNIPAKLVSFEDYVNDLKVYYSIATYEGVDSYYQVMSWTLSDRRDKYAPKMDQINYSFKEIMPKVAVQ